MSHQPRQVPSPRPSGWGRHRPADGGQEHPEAPWWRSKPAVVVWALIVLFTLAGILGDEPEDTAAQGELPWGERAEEPEPEPEPAVVASGPVGTASCEDPTGDIVEPVDQPAAEQLPGLDLTGIDLHARGDDLVITWEAAGSVPRDGPSSLAAYWGVDALPDDGDPISFGVSLIGGTFYAGITNLVYLDPLNPPLSNDPVVDGNRLTHVFPLDEIELPERFRWRGSVLFGEVDDLNFSTDLCPDEDETGDMWPGRFPE